MRPVLGLDADFCEQGSSGITVGPMAADLLQSLRAYLRAGGLAQSILQVSILDAEAFDGDVPGIAGEYQVLENGFRFVPYFPFEPGLSYRASFDPYLLCLTDPGRFENAEALTLKFLLPRERPPSPAKVEQVFPTSDELPENLLRFYIRFANPMQRNRASKEIALLGPDGKPAEDVLYRAPIELWDRSMKCLTILLDPGRLKRGVGPNRELGPPLKPGQTYTLVIGAGMTDLFDNPLSEPVYKHFHVTQAVRESIAIKDWRIELPLTHSLQPLIIHFPAALDWALLFQCITIAPLSQPSIEGRIEVEDGERRWVFTPACPWQPGAYEVRVAADLEDCCGNGVAAAFDRKLRAGAELDYQAAAQLISFELKQIS